MYKIIGADQKEYGPVSADELRQWIAEGRANGQTAIQKEGSSEWKPLSSYPEFAASLAASPSASATPRLPLPGNYATLPADITQRDYDVDIGSCLGRSWELLKKNFGLVFGGTALFLFIQLAIAGLSIIPIVGALVSLASIFIAGPLMGGVYFFFLKIIRGQPAELGDIFAGFRLRFAQLLLVYLVMKLLALLVSLPGLVVTAIPIFRMVRNHQADGPDIILAMVGFFLAIIPLTYITTCWVFSIPLVIDKHLDFWPAMQTSRKVVTKHFGKILGLLIVCGLINIPTICTFYIGLFITIPIVFGAMMYAYEDIFGQRTAPVR